MGQPPEKGGTIQFLTAEDILGGFFLCPRGFVFVCVGLSLLVFVLFRKIKNCDFIDIDGSGIVEAAKGRGAGAPLSIGSPRDIYRGDIPGRRDRDPLGV